ncbi:MAG: helix-hairpin-helix domain-containing protein [Planctomycetaceae bacterium]|nr:helix-hairpin-helix domain-containing protein [Planctomycetaceae bacterium]
MVEPVTINLSVLSQKLGLPQEQVQTVVTLLDEGYPAPFIARYRKDITGQLDETNIRFIASELRLLRSLSERKQAILKAIESAGELQPELDKKIRQTQSLKQLEDLYLPFKPKKQSNATAAKEKGLNELANEILEEKINPENLDSRAADFINNDKNIKSIADVILGTGLIIAEKLAEKSELIQKIRELLRIEGKLITKKIESKNKQNTTKTTQQNINENKNENKNEIEQKSDEKLNSAETESTTDSNSENEQKTNAEIIVTNNNDNIAAVESETKTETESETESNSETEIESNSESKSESEVDVNSDSKSDTETESTNTESAEKTDSTNDAKEITEQFLELRGSIVGDIIKSAKSKIASGKKKLQQQQPLQQSKVKDDAKQRREDAKTKEREHLEHQFADFFDYSCCAGDIPPQKILAFNRGERERVLQVTIEIDENKIFELTRDIVAPREHKFADFLSGCLKDAIHRVLLPSLERELRLDMTEYAENYAVRISSQNLRNLLFQPPLNRRRVLAIDPSFKFGCKIASLDEFGNVLGSDTIFLTGGSDRNKASSIKKLAGIIERDKIAVIAIGNGSGCREAEAAVAKLIADSFADKDISYVIVNETGVRMYASGSVARDEFPNYDSSLRGAISIGRRLQDPLSEIVKIDAENLNVGMYQHEIKVKRLRETFNDIVESCVNFVGVDVNSATPSILRYVSGLNRFTAKRIYDYRLDFGQFRTREEFLKVSGIGGVTFTGCAGFLKIYGGVNPLDATWIHPESYHVATSLIEKFGFKLEELRSAEGRRGLSEKISNSNIVELALKYSLEFGIGVCAVTDILEELKRISPTGNDPRESLPKPMFRKGLLKFEELQKGMELTGVVSNVVEFGVFVDVGLQEPGLVHISQVSDKYIRDAYEKVSVGAIVRVWVSDLDDKKKRLSLTMLPPGTLKESKRGSNNVSSDGDVSSSTKPENERGEGGERRQRPIQNRELRRRGDFPSRVGVANRTRGVRGDSTGQTSASTSTSASALSPSSGAANKSVEGRVGGVRGGQFVSRGSRELRGRVDQGGQGQGGQSGQRFSRGSGSDQRLSATRAAGGSADASGAGTGSSRATFSGHGDRGRGVVQDRAGRFNSGERRGGGGDRAGRMYDKGEKRPKTYVAPPKIKELKPITENMRQGKEPLRSFGDLAQLLGRVQIVDPVVEKKQKKSAIKKPEPTIKENNETEPTTEQTATEQA